MLDKFLCFDDAHAFFIYTPKLLVSYQASNWRQEEMS